jgi:hypothetical protein
MEVLMKNKLLRNTALLAVFTIIPQAMVAQEPSDAVDMQIPDKRIVDCLLLGHIRKLGNTIYQAPPRAVRIPAIDCKIRGGDFLMFDRASFATSLSYWLEQAKGGDQNAQIYVAEIFERGLGREPDYVQAAAWYKRAADSGHPVAQISLAQLYEKGLGVEQNPKEAERLYQLAFGPGADISVSLDSSSLNDPAEKIRSLERSLADARNDSSALKEQLQTSRQNSIRAEKALTQQEIEEQRLSEELQAAQDRVDSLALADAEQQLSAQRELERRSDDLAAHKSTITQLRMEVDRNQRQLQAYQVDLDRITELESELQRQSYEYEEVNLELKQTRLELVASNNRIVEQEQAVEAERGRLQVIQEQLLANTDSSSQSKKVLEDRIQESEAKITSQAVTLDNLNEEIESGRNQSRELQNRLSELRQQNEDLLRAHAEADRYRQESERLQVALADTQAQLSTIEAAKSRDIEVNEAQNKEELARVQEEAEGYKKRLDDLEKKQEMVVELAAPAIELIDPLAFATRGAKSDVAIKTDKQQQIVGKVIAPAGLLSLSVNQEPTEVNTRNVFTRVIDIQGRETPVVITAIDNQGKRTEKVYSLINDHISEFGNPNIDFGEFHALLIGNEEYEQLPNLQTPKNDIKVLGDILRDRYGFDTTVIEDGSREQIMDSMYELLGKLDSEDNLLIYYAGHGEYVTDTNRGVWLPVDANPSSPANWISNVEINDYLKQIRAKGILVVADSCYSGSLTRSAMINLRPGLTDEEYEAHLRKMSKIRARVVLTSGGLAPVLDSANPGAKNSIFAAALIEILSQNHAILSAQDLGRTVAAKVSLAASRVGYEQEPQYAPLNHANHQGGDFFFVPVAPAIKVSRVGGDTAISDL